MNMTEEIPETEFEPADSRTHTIIQHGRTGYDLIHGFFTSYGVQGVILVALLLTADSLLGWPANPLVLLFGFFMMGFAAYLLFPHAAWNWELETNLENREIDIRQVTVEEAKQNLDRGKAKRQFSDKILRTVTVFGEHLALSQVHTISDIDYLADTRTLEQALEQLPDLVVDYAKLKAHRGLEVSQLASLANEEIQKVLSPPSSDDIRGIKDDLTETAIDKPELRHKKNPNDD